MRDGLDRVLAVRYDEESGSSRVEQDTPVGLESDDAARDEYAAAGAAD